MIANSALARPYARALFECAQEADAVDKWQKSLLTLSSLFVDKELSKLLAAPTLSKDKKVELLLEVAGKLEPGIKNLLALLAQNERLTLLPEIHQQFVDLSLRARSIVQVEVLSARAMKAAELKKLQAKLGEHWQAQEVQLEVKVDPSLIAGVVCRSGDKSIDYSLKGQISKLAKTL